MRAKITLALAAASALVLGACAPGSGTSTTNTSQQPASSVSTDPAKMGDVTLTLWDQEVRGGGNDELTQLISSFQTKYPNIKIKRVSRSFDDLVKTLRLALSGNDAPDVVQANNNRGQMGEFVKAKQLIALTPYEQAYKWDDRYPASVRAVASYSADGKTFGEGQLYGLPQMGEVVGIYYNKSKLKSLGIEVPKDWASFEAALAKAKSKGETPLQFGNLEKWPAVHVFGVVQGATVPATDIRKLGFGNSGASWTTDQNTSAAQTLVDWADKGYFTSGFNGLGYDPAWQAFGKGTGVFLIGGTWLGADLNTAMGDNVGFLVPPPATAGQTTYTTGASSLPFAITAKSAHPDAAAAFIDYITSADAMKVIAQKGNLPVLEVDSALAPNSVTKDEFAAYATVTKTDGLLPYLDWATPTMSDTIGAGLQDMLAKKKSVADTLKAFQKDYGDFTAGN